MKNTLLLSAVAAAALLSISTGPSSANTCGGGAGCVPATPFVFNSVPNSESFSDGQSGAGLITTSAFTDTFDFQLAPPPTTYNSIASSVSSGFGSDLGMTLSLFFCGLSACDSGGTQEGSTATGTGVGTTLTVAANLLGDGFYYIKVTGGSSNNIQSYGGTLDVAGAPLPAALPLFVGGLGMLGFAGLRKRRGRTVVSSLPA